MEIDQLLARFPGDRCQLVEKGRERTSYRITLTPSDPEWVSIDMHTLSRAYSKVSASHTHTQSFSFKTVKLMVTFPAEYPSKPFLAKLPNDQGLPPTLISHGNEAIATQVASMCGEGKGTALSLRPFLHWLDKNLGELFQEALRKVRKDCEKEFVNMMSVGKYTVYVLVFLISTGCILPAITGVM